MKKISKVQAEALWADIRDGLVLTDQKICEVIESRAWEPLGYSGFADAWREELAGVRLAAEIRVHVVYQFAAEGFSAADIADMVSGVSELGAESLIRQRRNGVPAGHAVVREHHRRPSAPPSHLRLDVGSTMLQEYRRIAAVHGLTAEEIAVDAVRERFRELAVVKRKKAGV